MFPINTIMRNDLASTPTVENIFIIFNKPEIEYSRDFRNQCFSFIEIILL